MIRVTAICNECGHPFDLSDYDLNDMVKESIDALEDRGWYVSDGEDLHLCVECKEVA